MNADFFRSTGNMREQNLTGKIKEQVIRPLDPALASCRNIREFMNEILKEYNEAFPIDADLPRRKAQSTWISLSEITRPFSAFRTTGRFRLFRWSSISTIRRRAKCTATLCSDPTDQTGNSSRISLTPYTSNSRSTSTRPCGTPNPSVSSTRRYCSSSSETDGSDGWGFRHAFTEAVLGR